MKERFTNYTMADLKAMLNENVDKFNNVATTQADKIDLRVEIKDIIEACNELSLLTVYSDCLADEQPVVKFASAYVYDTISAKYTVQSIIENGKSKSSEVCEIKDGTKTLAPFKFIEWAKARNKIITADACWIEKVTAAREAIVAEWKKYMASNDGYAISKNVVKSEMQKVFDALVFIPCENAKDKNAIIAKRNVAEYIIALAADKKVVLKDRSPNFTVSFLTKSWEGLIFDSLHMSVKGKTYDIDYGDKTEEAEAEPKAEEPKAETKTKGKKSK
jgi:hypothetical protein